MLEALIAKGYSASRLSLDAVAVNNTMVEAGRSITMDIGVGGGCC